MKSLTRGHLKAGLDSVRGAKMRNFWTMLGIIIGVTSVITVVSIGEGVKQQVNGQVHHLGKDLITVQPAELNPKTSFSSDSIGSLAGLRITGSLSQRDVDVVTTTKGVALTAPLSAVTGTVHGDKGNYNNGLIMGTTADLSNLLNQSMAYGVFLSDDDIGQNVAVLGSQAAKALFDVDVPLGHSFTFHGQTFIVHGIFNDFSDTPLSAEDDFNNAIFIPYDVSESLTNNTAPTYQILARPNNPAQAKLVATSITNGISKVHGGNHDFSVLQQNQNVANSSGIVNLLTRLIAGVAAISLLVGGVGIMNVMLVSVAERMHEIGIRKAVGATDRQILSQFMIEASTLSLTGGVIGVILAYIIEFFLRAYTDLQPIITWQIVLLATGVSLAVGIIFGTIPAVKAARKAPIEALRSE